MNPDTPKRNVFHHLLVAMIVFGLLTGIVFPFFAKSVLHYSERPLPGSFIILCVAAGFLVGLVNYLLFHLVISNELDRVIRGMRLININIRKDLLEGHRTEKQCEIEVSSCDRLGEVVTAFNEMGRTIDDRQRWEGHLRTVMNQLSDSIDLSLVGKIIVNHLPAPPAWQYALVYTLIEEEYSCIAIKSMNKQSVPKRLTEVEFSWLKQEKKDDFQITDTAKSCFEGLELQVDNEVVAPHHISVNFLFGDEQCIGFILVACHQSVSLTDENRRKCRAYCDHVQPYLRSALLHEKLEKIATIDELSQALTRRAGMSRLRQECSGAVRYETPLSVIVFDIDHFKRINDAHGHRAGDQVIRAICGRIVDILRDEDILFRYGGDEFVIILPHIDLAGAVMCAERVRLSVRDQAIDIDHTDIFARISLGVASWTQFQARKADTLITMADKSLYWAKQHGRDQVGVWVDSESWLLCDYLAQRNS